VTLDFPNLHALPADFDLCIDPTETHEQAIVAVLSDKIASSVHTASRWKIEGMDEMRVKHERLCCLFGII
jgi:hypothetical protein